MKNKPHVLPGVKAPDGPLKLRRKQICINDDLEAILAAIGGGNLSLGIREAARRLNNSKNMKPFGY